MKFLHTEAAPVELCNRLVRAPIASVVSCPDAEDSRHAKLCVVGNGQVFIRPDVASRQSNRLQERIVRNGQHVASVECKRGLFHGRVIPDVDFLDEKAPAIVPPGSISVDLLDARDIYALDGVLRRGDFR